MEIYSKAEALAKEDIIVEEIRKGKLFIHPTDTIYGIGCDATNSSAVKKIREIKEHYARPFSIIAPSKTWIRENCVVDAKVIEWLKKMPGAYTLILKLKNRVAVAPETNNNMNTIGIRIVDHQFQQVVDRFGKPVVTTSANKVGNDFMTSLDNLDPRIKPKIDFILNEGEKAGRPSTIVDLSSSEETIQRR